MKSLCFVVCLLLSTCLSAQPHRDEYLFQKAELIEALINGAVTWDKAFTQIPELKQVFNTDDKRQLLLKAVTTYKQLIDSYPTSAYLLQALYNKGSTEHALHYSQAATETFTRLLQLTIAARKKDTVLISASSRILARLYMDAGNYVKAMEYLQLTQRFPERPDCGVGILAEPLFTPKLYAECYLGLNQKQKALDLFLPMIFHARMPCEEPFVVQTYHTLLKLYTHDALRQAFDTAFLHYSDNNDSSKQDINVYLLNTKINLANHLNTTNIGKPLKQELIKFYQESFIYKLLHP